MKVFSTFIISSSLLLAQLDNSATITKTGTTAAQFLKIGVDARAELERIFDCHVQLFLFVKVRENWRDDPERYREWGLDFNA